MCHHSTAEQRTAENEKRKKNVRTKQSCMAAILDHMTISYENTM